MATKKKMLMSSAGAAGGAGGGLDIDDVFSTYLYEGNGSTQTITNGIDLDGEGGLVWIKNRENDNNNSLIDSERGVNSFLQSDTAVAAYTGITNSVLSLNSNGFTLGQDDQDWVNKNTQDHVSWTFRKAPKFFTCLTYTGTGSAQSISHDLGSAPGMVIVKRTDASYNWECWHSGLTDMTKYIRLNSTEAERDEDDFSINLWNQTAPTDTSFTVGTWAGVNTSGATYVAYLFAHNDGDGEFGPDGDQDIIKCGSYTGNGSDDGPEIDLGFEPQWILVKSVDQANKHWLLADAMREWTASGQFKRLRPHRSDAEDTENNFRPTATGFKLTATGSDANTSGGTYIYMAIRRGPLAPPTAATEVFAIDRNDGTAPTYESGFPVDMGLIKRVDDNNSWLLADRLRGTSFLSTDSTNSKTTNSTMVFDYMEGWNNWGSSQAYYSWMWKRATGCFDAVAFTGTGSARTVSHNLGVAPEMMWVKKYSGDQHWAVYHSSLGAGKIMNLNRTNAASNNTSVWNSTEPTSSSFSVSTNNNSNQSGETYVAYLFASLPGISKVGSYTGTAATLNIDCGFTSGARFVLLKRTDSVSEWQVFDTARGIVAGNDPIILLNRTYAEEAFDDLIDPYSAGFTLTSSGMVNVSGGSYIFYAIA